MTARNSRAPTTQAKFDRLLRSCRRAGMTIDDLLAKPLPEISAFAARHGLSNLDLLHICDVLMETLNELERHIDAFVAPGVDVRARNTHLH